MMKATTFNRHLRLNDALTRYCVRVQEKHIRRRGHRNPSTDANIRRLCQTKLELIADQAGGHYMRSQILNELARYDQALSCHKLAERISASPFEIREELESMADEGTLERVKGQGRVTLYGLPSGGGYDPGGSAA